MKRSEQTFLQALDCFYQSNGQPEEIPDFPMFGISQTGGPSPLTSDLFINANLRAHISINAKDPYAPNYEEIPTSFVHTPYEDYTKLKYCQLDISVESKPASTHHTFDGEKEFKKASNVGKRSTKIKKLPKGSRVRNPNLRRLVSGTYQNIIKNFIKAISAFSTSDLALPYLIPLLDNTNVTQEKFVSYVFTYKEKVDSLKGLIDLTLAEDNESKETINCKKIFKDLSIIFLKYFAVNWIFGSTKLKHRKVLLKNRFIIKRKIENPDMKVKIIRPKRKSATSKAK